MKKKIFVLALIFSIVLFTGKVKAIYNGQGASVSISGGGSSKCNGANCQYNNTVYGPYLQIQLWYIDSTSGSWSQIGDTYYVTSPGNKGYLNGTLGVDSSHTITVDSLSGVNPLNYAEASRRLRAYFGDDDNSNINKIANQNLVSFLNTVTGGDYTAVMTKDTEVANKKVMAKKGYRVIIEPAIAYIKASWNGGGGGIMSPKDAAVYRQRTGATFNICSLPLSNDVPSGCRTKKMDRVQSKFLYTEFDDVGIKAHNESWCSDISVNTLADSNIGCGFNIIDVGKYVEKHYCYDKTVAGGLTCKNYDKNNESDSFKETYTERECTSEEDEKDTNSKYGKMISENDNCTLYCSESAFASFPGGISQDSYLGLNLATNSYFAWPARYGSKEGMKMYMTSTYKCRIVQKKGKTCSAGNINTLVDAAESSIKKLSIGAKLTAGNYRKIAAEALVVADSTTSKSNTSGLTIKKDEKDEKTAEFSVSKTSYLEIKNTTNRYYNKSTGAVSDSSSTWSGTTVFDRGQGVVSLSEKYTEIGKKYDLTISDVQLGTGNQFGKRIGDYTCNYQVPNTPCVCPSGTLREGDSLYLELTEGKTCLQLQKTYCNICSCPDDSTYSEWGKDLTKDIVGEEITSKSCKAAQQKFCYHKTCDDNKVSETTFKSCVDEQMKKYNRTLGEATTICDEKYCPPARCERVPKDTWDKCRNDGYSYATCYRKYCPYPGCKDCKYHCTTTAGEEKDISQCISDRQAKYGETFRDAKVRCTAVACPSNSDTCKNGKCPPEGNNCTGTCVWTKTKKGNTVSYVKTCDGKVCLRYPVYCPNDKCIKSNNVVYRTIDLDNPFPGNKNGVTTQFSNDGLKGRLPSTNWYYIDVVRDEILNARGAKGSKLYTEKTPLYTIVLTPAKIKEIREYNKGKEYTDFKLECKNEEETAACISNFLHTTIYEAIDRKNSVANCYNISKDEAGFNACYNKDN